MLETFPTIHRLQVIFPVLLKVPFCEPLGLGNFLKDKIILILQ